MGTNPRMHMKPIIYSYNETEKSRCAVPAEVFPHYVVPAHCFHQSEWF